jgi:TusA-related sulfurtransferase
MKLDTSGLSCPEPVLKTKKALKSSPKNLEVIVDNTTAQQNVIRFLKSQKYKVTVDGLTIKGQI